MADHRVLKLFGERGASSYLLAGDDEGHPARPLPGLAVVLAVWAPVNPVGWAAGWWLTSPQVELAVARARSLRPTAHPALGSGIQRGRVRPGAALGPA